MSTAAGQILIVDDHAAVRKALRSLVSSHPDWTVCGEATDGIDAVEKAKKLLPQVILMDISMPRLNGLEATRVIRRELPDTKVIVVSQNEPEVVHRQVREIDAAGFVAKSEISTALLPMLDKVTGRNRSIGGHDSAKSQAFEPTWLAGGGDLGRLIREHDWSKTSLGPLDHWPQSLKTSVSLILSSQHPMWVGWGPEMTFLYNDAYIQVLSLAKHPAALGKPAAEVWAEIWDICGPLADKVYQKGEASFVDDVRLFMNRGDFLEETYYSFSYSPIRDESGKVAGLFCPSTEVSPKVINARRLRTLSELSARALTQKTVETACASAFATLANNPDDLPFAILYLTDGEGTSICLEQCFGVPGGIASLTPQTVCLAKERDADFAGVCWPFAKVLNTSYLQSVDVRNFTNLPLGPAHQPVSEALVLPVTSRAEDRPLGVLIAGVNPTRKLDAEYRTFYNLIAGQIAGAIQNVRAVEEERKRLEALAEIDRAKTAFFSNVSHEFRTPLTLMLGPVEDLLAKSYTGLSPAAKGQLELVNRNGTRLLRLVNTLLDFSRIEAGRMQAIYQPTNLSAFTAELASVFRSATEKAGLKLELSCPKLTQPVFVDRNMWEKIVLNLISNAFKFTFEGTIAVSLQQAGENVELRVRDTGVGIPQHEIPRLFDRFHRIENTRSRTHEGSGIGLALVLELVKLHGGAVRVESVTGKGSSFIVSIPLGSAHLPSERIGGARTLATTAVGAAPFVEEALRWLPESEQTVEAHVLPYDELMPVPCPTLAEEDTAVEKRPRVLVADDNSDMRQYLTRLLSERYEVRAVPDGKAALEEARSRVPDLVLSDVMMPNLDGFGLLEALRRDPGTRTIPIILLSARAGEESRVEGMEHGADDYLIKPFSARELLARVQTHLEMARVRKEAEEALRQRTAQFETLLSAAPVAVYVVDADFRIREMNPQAMAALDNGSHIGSNLEEFIRSRCSKEEADEILYHFHHTLETGYPYSVPEWKKKSFDGNSNVVYEWQINRIPLPDGRHGVVCYFRDISHIVKAREAIAASELRLRLAQKAARSGTWERNLTTGQLFVSPEMQELWGFPSEGHSDDSPTRFRDAIRSEDMARIDKDLSQLLEDHSTEYHVEYRITRSDGVLRWIESNGQIFYDADGKPERLIGISTDITERKQVEERERQLTAEAIAANAKFRAVFEQTPVFAGIASNDGILIDANRLSLDAAGYRAEDVLGRPLWETPWWRKIPTAQDAIRNAAVQAAQGNPYREVLTYHWADGTERLLEFALHPIRDHEGKVIFLHPTGVDITDLKRAEANYRSLAESLDAEVRARTRELELRNEDVMVQSEQLRDLSRRLLQVQDEERRRIARELHDSAGQILTALGMNLGRLAQQARKNGSQLAGDAEEGQQLVQQLTQEIRTMSYLLHPPLLDETGLAEAVRWYIQGLADRNGLEIKLNVSKDFGRLSREAELVMFRLVQECLTNIHRHSGSKTALIELTRDGESVCLEIRDQGKGISPEKLAQIQSKGSGVGITGMRERVRQFGGRMDIASNASGTRISFTLPLGNAPSRQSPASLPVPA